MLLHSSLGNFGIIYISKCKSATFFAKRGNFLQTTNNMNLKYFSFHKRKQIELKIIKKALIFSKSSETNPLKQTHRPFLNTNPSQKNYR